MEITNMKQAVKFQQWGEMIRARKESGMTVDAWCKESGVSKKTYYYRLKQLRLEALKESDAAGMLPAGGTPGPAFAELDFSKPAPVPLPAADEDKAVVTVRIGAMLVGIHNGACAGVIADTLRVVKEIC